MSIPQSNKKNIGVFAGKIAEKHAGNAMTQNIYHRFQPWLLHEATDASGWTVAHHIDGAQGWWLASSKNFKPEPFILDKHSDFHTESQRGSAAGLAELAPGVGPTSCTLKDDINACAPFGSGTAGLAGLVAGVPEAIVTTPFQLVKVRMQVCLQNVLEPRLQFASQKRNN